MRYKMGSTHEITYHLRNQKGVRQAKITRDVRFISEDAEYYYVQTGPIAETPIRKDDIE